jgi:hypothetical protein
MQSRVNGELLLVGSLPAHRTGCTWPGPGTSAARTRAASGL